MQATVEIQVVPIGNGVSVREDIKQVVSILKGFDFLIETHASGTNVEGEMSEIFKAIEKIHESLHESGTVRLLNYLKLETRTDKTPSLAGKRL
ncbi:MAG: MTH1187 family thiamine-binding protein [Gammaproteobacteria bacterium]|nr:MTH1187 family thiamine-binding protein [Gammaproteobacteria bacterium]